MTKGRAWVAVPYLTGGIYGRLIENLGGVPVIRPNDYKSHNACPSNEDVYNIREALLDKTLEHLADDDSILVVLTSGSKGATKIRNGIGLLLESSINIEANAKETKPISILPIYLLI